MTGATVDHSRTRRRYPAMLAGALAAGLLAWAIWLLGANPGGEDIAALVFGTGCAVSGLLVWWQRPGSRFAGLLLVIAASAVLPTLQQSRVPMVWTLGIVGDSWFAALIVYLALAFPQGRLEGWFDRLVVSLTVLPAVVWPAVISMLYDPRTAGCGDCPPGLNAMLVSDRLDLVVAHARWHTTYVGVWALFVSVRLGMRLYHSTPIRRRVLAPVVVPVALFNLIHAVTRWIRLLFDIDMLEYGVLVTVSTVTLTAIPVGVLLGLLRARARRSRVGDLVLELGELPGASGLRDAVARTLGDPSTEVGFWVRETESYRTAAGDALQLPPPGSGREVTYVEGQGEPLAAIVHDAALLDEPRLVDAVRAAARFAVENERLRVELLARLEEVVASRARIVEAGDAERKRIERNLHDGAQQRLLALALKLRTLRAAAADPELNSGLGAAADEVMSTLDELRTLAQGLHPATLTEGGLHAAIEELAERCPVPVTLDLVPGRFSETAEATVYYTVAEALANVAKHAQASRVSVEVRRDGPSLIVRVFDDGVGRNGTEAGSGLRGLSDRVAAVRGSFEVVCRPGAGTAVIAEVPCE